MSAGDHAAPLTDWSVVGRHPRHVKYFNALIFKRFTLFLRGLPIDSLSFSFAVVDFSRLFSKIIANITAIFDDLLSQLSQFSKRRDIGLRLFRLHRWGSVRRRGMTRLRRS